MSGVKGMGSRHPKRTAMLIEELRTKIQTPQIINRLQAHIHGAVEMSATQVRAAEILLKKAIPDLQSVTHNAGESLATDAMSLDQLFAIVGRRRDPIEPTIAAEPGKVH